MAIETQDITFIKPSEFIVVIRIPVFFVEVGNPEQGLGFHTFSRIGPDRQERKQLGWVYTEESCQVNRNAAGNPDVVPLSVFGENQQTYTAEQAVMYGKAKDRKFDFKTLEEAPI